MQKKSRDDIKLADVTQLLDITKPEALEMASYCEKNCISGLCCECPHRKPCQRVNDELMEHPILNGKPMGAYYMSDLLYYMKRGGASKREDNPLDAP